MVPLLLASFSLIHNSLNDLWLFRHDVHGASLECRLGWELTVAFTGKGRLLPDVVEKNSPSFSLVFGYFRDVKQWLPLGVG